MANVYCYFDASEHADPAQAALLRVWVRSWKARGWKPRILTVRNAAKHADYALFKGDNCELPRLAQEAVRAKWLCPLNEINFSFTPAKFKKLGLPRQCRFGNPGWKEASVVNFPCVSDLDIIEKCGRPL